MAGLELAEVILAVIIGTLAAIVYSLRILILVERRVGSMEANIQRMTSKILREETIIEGMLKSSGARKIVAKKSAHKKKKR